MEIQDEHVEALNLDDTPDLVVIQVYITSAYGRAHRGRLPQSGGACVALGGLHVTSRPKRPPSHADTIFIGPGEDTWPQFLSVPRRLRETRISIDRQDAGDASADPARSDQAASLSRPQLDRRLARVPARVRLLLLEAFFEGGRSFYTQTVDAALAEIERLPGRHLYFLDDHLFGDRRFASALSMACAAWDACGKPLGL